MDYPQQKIKIKCQNSNHHENVHILCLDEKCSLKSHLHCLDCMIDHIQSKKLIKLRDILNCDTFELSPSILNIFS